MEKSTFTPEYAILREELVALRKNAGLTQREVARRLDVPPSWVAKVEMGERRIDVVELCRLAAACDADAAEVCSRLATQIVSVQSKRHRKGKLAR